MRATNKKEKYQKIMEKKLGTPIDVLCKGFPGEFVTFLTYCRNLKFEDKPDYTYLKTLLKDLFVKSGYEMDYQYDWNILAKKKKDEKSTGEVNEEEKLDTSKDDANKTTQATKNTSMAASKSDNKPQGNSK